MRYSGRSLPVVTGGYEQGDSADGKGNGVWRESAPGGEDEGEEGRGGREEGGKDQQCAASALWPPQMEAPHSKKP